MSARPRPTLTVLALALAAVLGTTSCSLLPSAGDGPLDPAPRTSSSTSTADPGEPRSVPPGFLECDDQDRSDATAPAGSAAVADVDLTRYAEVTPTGFEPASGYIEDQPVEGDWTVTAFVPVDQAHSLDALGMVVFPEMELGPLEQTCGTVSWADVEARVARYDELRRTVEVAPDERTTVAGLPAVKETVEIPEGGYTTVAYWIFGRGQVARVWCQWVEDAETIRRGCDEYVAGLTFS
ncbi:hypothetical protein C8046_01675 [Serinibacter arcticus]|uniref:Serine/threonine protein kinase n=1 Tax=Serinibacter arcticus TaxID=1655435 RepID=A0A2U1ZRN2_9MICO|nr:hypothetical protein [Serinibacter arcticus]PWD49610.1 hypothetical protein C8046_01675 [Serinibacter arcticus]